MNKNLIIGGIILILILFGGWFVFNQNKTEELTERFSEKEIVPEKDTTTTAWIEVVKDKVVLLGQDGVTEVKVFATGDSVLAGQVLKTDSTGQANINFSDGSSLRLDINTKLTINEATLEENTGSLKVKVALVAGKLWSKITALATPESYWEVHTGTAVATVRGSAFGTEVDAVGATLIIGSEHDISVAPLDPDTGEQIENAEIIVTEENEVIIKPAQVLALKKLTREERKEQVSKIFEQREIIKDTSRQNWIKQNEEHDAIIREKVVELREKGLGGRDLRRALREQVLEGLPMKIIEQKLEQKMEQKIPNTPKLQDTIINKPTPNATQTTRPSFVALRVMRTDGVDKIIEGTTLTFKAMAEFSDGTKKDVTANVTWRVAGSIGRITSSGVFEAALGPDVSEIGIAFGAVTASWKNEAGPLGSEASKEFFDKSSIITVIAAPPDPSQDLRG